MRARRTQVERSEETQEKVITAAIELMSKRGYAGFRVSDVAEAAGVSRGAQLHHFSTKEALVAAVLQRVFENAREEVEARARQLRERPNIGIVDLIDAILADASQFFFSNGFRIVLDMALATSNGDKFAAQAREIFHDRGRPNEEVWVDYLVEFGIDIERARDMLWLIRSVVRGLMMRSLSTPDPEQQARVMAMTREMVMDRLAACQP